MEDFKFGEKCVLREDVRSYRKAKKVVTNVLIPAGSIVTIISASNNMAIIQHGKESFATRIENLQRQPQTTTPVSG